MHMKLLLLLLLLLAQLARYVLLIQFGPIGSAGPIGAICPNELMPIGPIGSIGPIGAICPIDANWANWFHGPNWRDMYYVCQLGQLVPRAQLAQLAYSVRPYQSVTQDKNSCSGPWVLSYRPWDVFHQMCSLLS